jgi:hypothetical protein
MMSRLAGAGWFYPDFTVPSAARLCLCLCVDHRCLLALDCKQRECEASKATASPTTTAGGSEATAAATGRANEERVAPSLRLPDAWEASAAATAACARGSGTRRLLRSVAVDVTYPCPHSESLFISLYPNIEGFPYPNPHFPQTKIT